MFVRLYKKSFGRHQDLVDRNIHVSNENGSFTLTRFYLFSVTAKIFTGFDSMCEYHDRFVTRVPPWVTLVEHELLNFHENLSSPLFCGGVLVFCVVLLYVFMFCVPCCDVRYQIHIITMFGSSLSLVACRRIQVLFSLYVFACA